MRPKKKKAQEIERICYVSHHVSKKEFHQLLTELVDLLYPLANHLPKAGSHPPNKQCTNTSKGPPEQRSAS